MAHPSVASSSFEVGDFLGSNNAQPLPSDAAAGDLILYFICNDGAGSGITITVSSGWTLLNAQTQGSNLLKTNIAARILDGTTGNNILSVSGIASDYVIIGVRIASGDHNVSDVSTDIPNAAASSASGNANPPSLNTGVSRDWLWLAVAAVDFNNAANTISGRPTNFSLVENQKSAASTTSVGEYVAYRKNTNSTLDPGTFTNSSRPWIAYTVAIPPSEAGPTGTGASTLTNATSAASGIAHPVGSSTSTLANATSNTDGEVVTGYDFTGTSVVTVDAVDANGAGALFFEGDAASTLSNVASNGSGALYEPLGTSASVLNNAFVDANEDAFGFTLPPALPKPSIHESNLTIPPAPPTVQPAERRYLDTALGLVMAEFNRLGDASKREIKFLDEVADRLNLYNDTLVTLQYPQYPVPVFPPGTQPPGLGANPAFYDEIVFNYPGAIFSLDSSGYWPAPFALTIYGITATMRVANALGIQVLHNGVSILAETLASTTAVQTFSVTRAVNPGDRLQVALTNVASGTAEDLVVAVRYVAT